MAAEPRKSPASRMYGRGPKIEADREPPGGAAGGGAPAEPVNPPQPQAQDEGPEGDVMAGTDGIPAHHHAHHNEREALHHKHQMELANLHHRHQHEHTMHAMGHGHDKHLAALHERHHEERRKMHTGHEKEMRDMHERHEETAGKGPTGGIREKEIGKAGTEPTR